MLYDFIAIDFETANRNNNSACSLGLVAVKENEIFETKYFLIQPPTLYFDERNVDIHGITTDDVKNSPKFPEVWEQIKHYFDDTFVVAHNAVFDMSVLKCCLIEYNLDIPNFKYINSIPITTCVCKGEGIGQSLKDRAQYFGIKIENHHNSLSDAIVCAKLVIETIKRMRVSSLHYLLKYHRRLPIKNFSELNCQKFFKKGKSKFENVNVSEILPDVDTMEYSHPLYGKNVVFTGELSQMSRREAMQIVVNLGGILKSTVSRKTDYLVVGTQDKSIVGDDGLSSKEEKAYELLGKGFDIQILNEDDFFNLINAKAF